MDFCENLKRTYSASEQSRELIECTANAPESIWIIIALCTATRISFLVVRIIFLFQMHRKQRILRAWRAFELLFHFLLCAATSSIEISEHSDRYEKIFILSVLHSRHQKPNFSSTSDKWKRFSKFLERASHDEASFFHQISALSRTRYFMGLKYWAKTSKATLLSTCHFVRCVQGTCVCVLVKNSVKASAGTALSGTWMLLLSNTRRETKDDEISSHFFRALQRSHVFFKISRSGVCVGMCI